MFESTKNNIQYRKIPNLFKKLNFSDEVRCRYRSNMLNVVPYYSIRIKYKTKAFQCSKFHAIPTFWAESQTVKFRTVPSLLKFTQVSSRFTQGLLKFTQVSRLFFTPEFPRKIGRPYRPAGISFSWIKKYRARAFKWCQNHGLTTSVTDYKVKWRFCKRA